jgi:hypothetical protein
MSERLLIILTLGTALALSTPALQADQGNGHKNGHGNKHSDDDDHQGWQRREGYEYRTYGDKDARPAGWSRAKKTGWGNCGLPPGQAKKYGCYTYTYQGQPHYYYQDEQGQIIVRRPIIDIHGSIDISH